MAEYPALPLWTDAYLGDTRHLTTIEHGAYLLLLIAAWRTSTCDLPDDDRQLRRISGLTASQWARIGPTLRGYFKTRNGRLYSPRLADEREAVKQRRDRASQAGKASALRRKHRGSTTVDSKYQRKGNPQTQTQTQTQTQNQEKEEEGGETRGLFPDDPESGNGGGAARRYAFDGFVIKLNAKDLEDWRKLYPNIPNLEAEIDALDRYYGSKPADMKYDRNGKPIWWDRTKNALTKKDANYAKSTQGEPIRSDQRPWAI